MFAAWYFDEHPEWVALFYLVCATGALLWAVRELRVGSRSGSWPIAPGDITAVDIEEDSDGVKSVVVAVRYQVQGATFRLRETLPLGGLATAARVQQALRSVHIGDPVTVRYRPDRPQVARLRPGVRAEAFVCLGSAVLLFGGAVAVFGMN